MVKLEEGKFYRDAKGRKHGPVRVSKWDKAAFVADMDGRNEAYYHEDGMCPWLDDRNLIAEWTDGPVRTVTRLEVVPGVYDGVEVGSEVTGHPQREVMVRIAPDYGPMTCMDHAALARAAAVLTELAKAVRGNV